MPNEVKLLPCEDALVAKVRDAILKGAFNNDPTWLAMATDAARAAIEAMSRPTTVVTDEVVERVKALDFDEPDAFERWWQTYKHKNRELANYSIKKCIAFDAFHEALQIARAALASMPTVVTGEPLDLGDHALPPSGLSPIFVVSSFAGCRYRKERRIMSANHHVIRPTAIGDIADERCRQIEAEGWAPEHDADEHQTGDIARAAACYALGYAAPKLFDGGLFKRLWPDDWEWKPDGASTSLGCRRRQLVKAGALIVAEIERIDRYDCPKPAPLPERGVLRGLVEESLYLLRPGGDAKAYRERARAALAMAEPPAIDR